MGFIEHGLRIIAARPHLHFHQTLTFPAAILDAKTAKAGFNKFIKGVLKFYAKHDMAVVYFQETRQKDGAIHFHVCFLFFSVDRLPFCNSRMRRDFRTDIFKRWNDLNGCKAVHAANELKEHPFNQDSMNYFARAVNVAKESESTTRGETNWWGGFNNELIFSRSAVPTRHAKKSVFDAFFKKAKHQADTAIT